MSDTEIIRGIVQRVMTELPKGRAATFEDTAMLMMERVRDAGDGDHLEIGLLFGATLIMAALVKDAFGLKGECIGIDPLDGYYPPSPLHPDGVYSKRLGVYSRSTDVKTNIPITLGNLMHNLYYFKVEHRVRIVQGFSQPWPVELENAEFASAYIDGDHWDTAPVQDWVNVSARTRVGGIVWFDDWNRLFPDVQNAAKIACATPGWEALPPHNRQNFFLRRKRKV